MSADSIISDFVALEPIPNGKNASKRSRLVSVQNCRKSGGSTRAQPTITVA